MAATVEGAFVILDRASGPMQRMERQAKQLDRAIQGVHGNMKTWDDELKRKQGDLSRTERSLRNFNRETNQHSRGMRQATKDTETFGSALRNLGRNFMAIRSVIKPGIWTGMAAGIGVAIQAVGALGAGAVGLIPKLADLSGLVGALPASLTAIGGAALTAKLAMSGLTQAYRGSATALKRLTPEGRRFVAFLHEVGPRFRSIRQEAQKGLFPGLESALRRLSSSKAISTFQQIIGRFGRTLGGLASGAAQAVADPANLQRLNLVAGQGARILGRLGAALIPVYTAFLRIGVAARPMVNWMTQGIASWIRGRAEAVALAQSTGRLATWFDRARDSVSRLSSIGGNLWDTLKGIGAAARPLGESLWRGIDRTTRSWANFVNSVRGQGILRTQFSQAREGISQLVGLVGDLGKAFWSLGTSPGLANTTKALRGAVGPLRDLIGGMSATLGPAVAQLITNLAQLMATFIQGNGGLTRIVQLFADLAGSANALLGALKPLGPLIQAAFIVSAVRGLAGWVSRSAAAVWELTAAWRGTAAAASQAAVAQRAATGFPMGGGGPMGRRPAGVAGQNVPLVGGRQTGGIMGAGGRLQPLRNLRAAYYGGGRGLSGIRAAGSRGVGMAREALGGLRGAGALEGIGGGLMAGGAGLARFLGPVGVGITGLMAAEGFANTQGNFGRKLTGAASSLSFGLIGQPQSTDELGTRGQTDMMQELQSHSYSYQQSQAAILKLKQAMAGADRFDRSEMQGALGVLQQYADQQKQVLQQQQMAHLGQVLQGRGGLGALATRGVSPRRVAQLGIRTAIRGADLPEVQLQGARGLVAILKRQTGGAGKAWRETTEIVLRRLRRLGVAADVVAGKLVTGRASEQRGYLQQFMASPGAQNRASGTAGLTDFEKRWVRSLTLGDPQHGIPGDTRRNAIQRVLAREPKMGPHGANTQGLEARAGQRGTAVRGPGGLLTFPDLNNLQGPLGSALRKARQPIQKFRNDSNDDFSKISKQADQHTHDGARKVKKNWDDLKTALATDNQAMLTSTLQKFGAINTALRQKLGALGLSGPALQSAMTGGGGGGGGGHAGSPSHFSVPPGGARYGSGKARGGRLAGQGLQDTVPVPGGHAAPGELVVNRHTEKRINGILGIAGTDLAKEVMAETKPHSMAFAKGGRVPRGGPGAAGAAPGGVPGHPELHQGISAVTEAVLKQFPGLSITSTTGGGHVSGSYHYLGEATDISGSSAVMLQAANWIKSSGLASQLTEGIHNPNLAISDGHTVPNSFYSAVWAEHANHIHLAVAHAVSQILGGGGGGATGPAIPGVPPITAPQGFRGRGSARRAASQNALNALTHGANKKLAAAQGGARAGGVTRGGGINSWLTQALQITGHFTPQNLALLRGRAMQESSGNPNAINRTDSNAAAGHPSQGLLQTIPSTFEAYRVKSLPDVITDPVANAAAAINYMFARYGHIVGPGGGGYAKGGRLPGVSWFGRGMEGVARRPTVIGVGDAPGGEDVSVTPRSHGTAGGGSGGGHGGVTIHGGLAIHTGSGDPKVIAKAVEDGIVEAAHRARSATEESEAVLS